MNTLTRNTLTMTAREWSDLALDCELGWFARTPYRRNVRQLAATLAMACQLASTAATPMGRNLATLAAGRVAMRVGS